MHLLRITLPDQPGALGTVATALGRAGGDIVSVDVVERQADGRAVDDFLVELPMGGRVDELVSACQAIPGVRVVWLSRYAAGGDLHRDLEAVEAMTAAPGDAERVLVELAPAVFRGHWAMLLRLAGGARRDQTRDVRDQTGARQPDQAGVGGGERAETAVEICHATAGAPDLPQARVPWFPRDAPTRIDVSEDWQEHGWRHVVAAAVPLGRRQALVLGRSGGPAILDSELARLGHLASLARTIARTSRDT